MSGRAVSVEADLDSSVQALKLRVQSAFCVGKGQLLDSSGRVLPEQSTLKEAKLQSGASLTLHLRKVCVKPQCGSFAAILGDGSGATWGHAMCGVADLAVQDQLKNVQQIQASNFAFAAILGDGTVVTWGDAMYGGDSSAVQEQLKNVQ